MFGVLDMLTGMINSTSQACSFVLKSFQSVADTGTFNQTRTTIRQKTKINFYKTAKHKKWPYSEKRKMHKRKQRKNTGWFSHLLCPLARKQNRSVLTPGAWRGLMSLPLITWSLLMSAGWHAALLVQLTQPTWSSVAVSPWLAASWNFQQTFQQGTRETLDRRLPSCAVELGIYPTSVAITAVKLNISETYFKLKQNVVSYFDKNEWQFDTGWYIKYE